MLDRSGYLSTDDEYAQVAAGRRRDRTTHVVDRSLQRQRPKRAVRQVAILDAHDPVAHRAKQRLDHDIAAQLLEGQHRIVVALAGGRGLCGHAGERKHRAPALTA